MKQQLLFGGCTGCGGPVPAREHTILRDLCDRCLARAQKDAQGLLDQDKAFVAKYRHSPSFVREFAAWVLREVP